MNSSHKTAADTVANAYHTKDGGIIIPLDQFAREELAQGPEYVDQRVKVAPGSVLTFQRQLPQHLSLQGDSHVELNASTFIRDTVIKDSRVKMTGPGIVNIENAQIDHSKIVATNEHNGIISNYQIRDSLLKGDVHLASTKGHLCNHVYGRNLQAVNSNINGGIYDTVTVINSNIDQPGSTLVYDSDIQNSSLVNHEQTNKHWSALTHDAEHQIGETAINHSLIMNDRHHHFYTSGCKIDNTISINGLIGEMSDVYGPDRKIVLNNLDLTAAKLDFRSSPTSILAAGSKLFNPHVHENDVYYTELPHNRCFTPQKANRHFKSVDLPSAVLTQTDQLAGAINPPAQNQSQITQLDQALTQALAAAPTKALTPAKDDFLSL